MVDCETTTVEISNSGGNLTFNRTIRWKERQVCNPTIQDVPTRGAGQRIDTDVWVLKTRELRLRVRLNDAEKTTLLAIFDAVDICTITADSDDDGVVEWSYHVWFRSKKIVWDWSQEYAAGTERPWRADLVFDVEEFKRGLYCPCGATNQITNGGFETGDLTNWTTGNASVIAWAFHTGLYSALLDNNAGNEWINQDIESIKGYCVPVECVDEFYFWLKGNVPCPTHGIIDVLITYDDATTTLVAGISSTAAWVKHDLKPYLVAGKCISEVKFTNVAVVGVDAIIDDVTLTCLPL